MPRLAFFLVTKKVKNTVVLNVPVLQKQPLSEKYQQPWPTPPPTTSDFLGDTQISTLDIAYSRLTVGMKCREEGHHRFYSLSSHVRDSQDLHMNPGSTGVRFSSVSCKSAALRPSGHPHTHITLVWRSQPAVLAFSTQGGVATGLRGNGVLP